MKNILMNIRLLAVMLGILGLGLGVNSCRDSQLIDETEFNLFYPGVTDIGPSMTIPDGIKVTYIGAQPSDFAITGIKFGNENFQNDGVFTIDAATGTVYIENSENLAIGQYFISISCQANGKTWNFQDAIIINMMKPVPEEIKVDPAEFTIKMSDIIAGYFIADNYTAKIYSDSDAISITSYEISSVKLDGEILSSNKLFSVSTDGTVSMSLDENTTPGVYQISFKLYTILSGDDPEEGLFADALTVTISSAPTAITYPFLPVKVEQNGIARTSETPKVTGSQIDLAFELTSVYPESGADYISVDPATGAVIVKEGHPFTAGETYSLDITVSNDNGSTLFENACEIEVVDKINEVKGFSYDPVSTIRGAGFTAEAKLEAGDDVTYSFENLPAELSALEIDTNTGMITLPQGNPLSEGSYSVNVIARNYKNSITATLTITVAANSFYFTTVSWGTNLDDAHKDDPDYANQFRYPIGTSDIPEITIQSHDMQNLDNATFAISPLTLKAPNATIDEKTGAIKFAKTRDDARQVDIYLVTVTNGKGQTGETVIDIPVFLHSSAKDGEQTIEYTPLVCKINPQTGGTTHAPVLKNISDEERVNLLADYRRDFAFYNLGGPESHISNLPSFDPEQKAYMNNNITTDSDGNKFFLVHVWDYYWQTTIQHTASNYGSKSPMSYLANSGDNVENNGIKPKTLAMPLGYVNPASDYAVTINPRKFIYNNAWADGLFIGQIVWGIIDPAKTEKERENEVNGISGAGKIVPIVIWFDPNYEN